MPWCTVSIPDEIVFLSILLLACNEEGKFILLVQMVVLKFELSDVKMVSTPPYLSVIPIETSTDDIIVL